MVSNLQKLFLFMFIISNALLISSIAARDPEFPPTEDDGDDSSDLSDSALESEANNRVDLSSNTSDSPTTSTMRKLQTDEMSSRTDGTPTSPQHDQQDHRPQLPVANLNNMFANGTIGAPRGQSPRSRYCTSASDCHLDLNERCIARGTHAVCECREPFLRDSTTNSCELKRAIKVSVDFAQLAFGIELSKKNTPAYIRSKELVENTLTSVVRHSAVLESGVSGVRGVNFSASTSSLASSGQQPLTQADHRALRASCFLFVRESLYRQSTMDALSLLLVKEISVAVHELNASSSSSGESGTAVTQLPSYDLYVTEIDTAVDPCALEELNYCSSHADCSRNKYGGFGCSCRDRYTDASPHRAFPGEVCVVECPDAYCANGGHCHVNTRDASLYCTCNNWNVGARCQYSGIVVFSVLGIVVVLLLFVVGCTASAFCGQRASVLREVAYATSKPVTPVYDDHIRPFRITIDNPYDAPELHNNIAVVSGEKRLSQSYGPRFSPRPSVDENINATYSVHVTNSTAPTTPSPSPRPSMATAVQTDPMTEAQQALPRISVLPALDSSGEVGVDGRKNGALGRGAGAVFKVPQQHPGMTMGTAVTVGSSLCDKYKSKQQQYNSKTNNTQLAPEGSQRPTQLHQSHIAYF